MRVILWILQAVLAVVFLLHGWLFLSPPPDLAEIMNAQFPLWFRLFLGVAEVLAAVGLILPGLTRILPWLTPLAAAGAMIVVGSAAVLHLIRGEVGSAITTAVLCVIAAFVAYMRWKVTPITPRTRGAARAQAVTADPTSPA